MKLLFILFALLSSYALMAFWFEQVNPVAWPVYGRMYAVCFMCWAVLWTTNKRPQWCRTN